MPRYAAIDIGSNSVRMLAAEVEPGGSLKTLAEDRQVTRLGSDVFSDGELRPETIAATCEVLRRMSLAFRQCNVLGVRAVATSAVRDARNQAEFLRAASDALGVSVETISGDEEARLIYLGVQARWPQPEGRILVVDIGGGSAEIILGENGRLREARSRPLGAVRLTKMFLRSDPPTLMEIRQMEEFIDEKLAPALRRIQIGSFDRVIATSATASAVICAVNRIPRLRRPEADRRRATLPQIRKLYAALREKNLEERRKVTGIGPRRAEIIIAGTSVLYRIASHLGVRSLHYSTAGLRDGIIADLYVRGAGRERTRLSPEQRKVVEAFARKFEVEIPHARQVAHFAQQLFFGLIPLHHLPPEAGRLLEAAAYLRDVGHYINGSAHHKHSEYIVANSGLPGFTETERAMVAALCRYHRKATPAARHTTFQALTPDQRKTVLLLIPLLRIADALDRNRDQRVNRLRLEIRDGDVALGLESSKDTELEQWAIRQNAMLFSQVYGKNLSLEQGRPALG